MSSWFELTVESPPELDEALSSFLFDLGSVGLESVDHGGSVLIKAFFRDQPPTEILRRFCGDIGQAATPVWEARIHTREIDQEAWAENWKLHFQPIRVGQRLCVCPPWDSNTSPDLIRIVIDPGMAFGTGQHPTTRGCLELIEVAAGRPLRRAVDLGTGSGVLAIALCKLGAAEVHAIDNDASACRIAEENAKVNGCGAAMRVSRSLGSLHGSYDLAVANLYADLLRELAPRLSDSVRPGGALICSGFLSADEAAIVEAYSGFTSEQRRSEGGWTAVLLRRAEP